MDGGMPGAGGGPSTSGPSTGTSYKYGVMPGQGANKEDLAKRKKVKSAPEAPKPRFRPSRRGRKHGS